MIKLTLQDHQSLGYGDGITGRGINLGNRGILQKFAYLVGFNRGSIERGKGTAPSSEPFTLALGQALIDRTDRLNMMAKFTADPLWAGFEFQNGFDKWRVTVQRIDETPATTY